MAFNYHFTYWDIGNGDLMLEVYADDVAEADDMFELAMGFPPGPNHKVILWT